MEKEKLYKILVISIIIIIVLCSAYVLYNSYINNRNCYEVSTIGTNDYGSVDKIIAGNPDSKDCAVLIIGVHPREHKFHEAINETIYNICKDGGPNDLDKKYVIYYVHVNKNITSRDDTRNAGELLANEYVVPDVKSNNPFVVIDLHEIDTDYEFSNFISEISNDSKAHEYTNILTSKLDIQEYNITDGTSPQRVTIPISQENITTLLYETFESQSFDKKKDIANKFIYIVDGFKP